jgi:hypothetical protein
LPFIFFIAIIKMDDPYVKNAVIAVGGLFGLSVFAKLLHDPPGSYASQVGNELLENALHWRAQSDIDVQPIQKLQHAIYANAYLHAARSTTRDIDLERNSGVDVRKLKRGNDQKIKDSINSISLKCPKVKTSLPNI